MEETQARPPMTIVIPSRRGWSHEVRRTYDALREQSVAHGAEVLIMDGVGKPPPDGALAENARWIVHPDRSVHELRDLGYRAASGDIVACIEDHAVPAPDWIEAILRAYQEWPDAAAVGGCAINGEDEHAVDRASFYAGHAPMMPPLPRGSAHAVSAMQPTYRQEQMHEVLGPAGEVAVDQVLQQRMLERGMLLVTDDRIRATHHQTLGLVDTARIHFHNGRSFMAFSDRLDPGGTWKRAIRSALVPGPRTVRRLMTAYRRGEPVDKLLRTAPSLYLVLSAQAAGEVAGSILGPGDSPLKLH